MLFLFHPLCKSSGTGMYLEYTGFSPPLGTQPKLRQKEFHFYIFLYNFTIHQQNTELSLSVVTPKIFLHFFLIKKMHPTVFFFFCKAGFSSVLDVPFSKEAHVFSNLKSRNLSCSFRLLAQYLEHMLSFQEVVQQSLSSSYLQCDQCQPTLFSCPFICKCQLGVLGGLSVLWCGLEVMMVHGSMATCPVMGYLL